MKNFNKLIYKLKNNKLLLATAFLCAIIVLFDLAVAVFDLVELIKVSKNSASLSPVFFNLNMFSIAFSIFGVMLVVAVSLLIRFKKYNSN